jgi:hypothetical protein
MKIVFAGLYVMNLILSYGRVPRSARRANFSKSPKVDILQRFILSRSEEEYMIWMIRI